MGYIIEVHDDAYEVEVSAPPWGETVFLGVVSDADLELLPELELVDAVFVGDLDRTRELVAAGANVNDASSGSTPLLVALQESPEFFDEKAAAIVELLLDAGADVHGREPNTGRSPLHEAVRPGEKAVNLLLARGADPNTRSDDGSTPLHECAQYSAVSVARLLLEAGADMAATDRLGRTAGDLARQEANDYPENPEANALAALLAGPPGP